MKNFLLPLSALLLGSCINTAPRTAADLQNDTLNSSLHILDNRVLTAYEQASLSPDQVIEMLREGNHDFAADELTIRNNSHRAREAALEQYPKAVILSCVDSRVPVEDVFHRGIGDIFVASVAGNVVNPDILGSLEYACNISGAKLVMVLGHDRCGAIKSAVDQVEVGNLTELLAKIQPSVTQTRRTFSGGTTSRNEEFLHAVCVSNVKQAVRQIREQSPVLLGMEQRDQIKIIGGVYNMESGLVEFMEDIQ